MCGWIGIGCFGISVVSIFFVFFGLMGIILLYLVNIIMLKLIFLNNNIFIGFVFN